MNCIVLLIVVKALMLYTMCKVKVEQKWSYIFLQKN